MEKEIRNKDLVNFFKERENEKQIKLAENETMNQIMESEK